MLNPNIGAKLADGVMKKAIGFWVNECVAMLGQVKSEKFIKVWLRKKLKGCSDIGINYIYKLAQVEFEFRKQNHAAHQSN